MQPLEITLIVAATRSMGIGHLGQMPWQGLRKEMKYFARVTTRLPPQVLTATVLYSKTLQTDYLHKWNEKIRKNCTNKLSGLFTITQCSHNGS
jgi:hypothetical protein